MSVVFILLTTLFLSVLSSRHGNDRPSKNSNKLRIVLETSCCSNYRTMRREIFETHRCLERSKTGNKDLIFRKNCVIYAQIDENDNACYQDLYDNSCIQNIDFESIYYIDEIDYTGDTCAVQDVSEDDPCLLVYFPEFDADGTRCASSFVDFRIKPFYHLNYWYPNDDNNPYYYVYLNTTGVSSVENIDVWILDTGIDTTHIEFTGIDIEKFGFEEDDPETFNDHGTAVASQAIGNNVGVARGFSVKDCPACQVNSFFGFGCALEDIENCMIEILIYYSTRAGRRFVINMSFGGPESNYTENFDDLIDAGGILVAAAGNDATNNDIIPQYPANHELVISVGGYNQEKNIYTYFIEGVGGSNYGTNSVQYYAAAQDNLVALDSEVTRGNETDIYNSTELYTYTQGTSFASPIVAGEVANILARDLSLTLEDVLDELDSRVVGNVGNCPVDSCPMLQGYCNINGGTRSPTPITPEPTLEPTQNPIINLSSCISDICKYVNITILDFITHTSSIEINMENIFQVYPKFKSMKIRTEGTHTWQSDLTMTLSSPDNTQITLVNGIGGSNDDFNITFSDEADSFPSNLNVNGSEYKPFESFSNFNLQSPLGTWTFSLKDNFGGDTGIWESWCIEELCFLYEEGTASPTGSTMTPTSAPSVAKCENNIEFGLYADDLLPSDPSWKRMTLDDWNFYLDDIVNFYEINQGIPIIETFTRNYCCMKTSDNVFIYGEGLGFITLCHTSNADVHTQGDVYKFSGFENVTILNLESVEYDSLANVTSFEPTLCQYFYHTELFIRCSTINTESTTTSTTTEEPKSKCCQTSTYGRLINYQCDEYDRKQCVADRFCTYQNECSGKGKGKGKGK